MDRVYFTEYKGKQILIEDFSKLKPGDEFLKIIAQAQATIAGQPEKSVLALLDASGSSFNKDILATLSSFVQANTPYIRHAAVVGISGILEVALMTVAKAARRPFQTCASVEEAKDWLAAQP